MTERNGPLFSSAMVKRLGDKLAEFHVDESDLLPLPLDLERAKSSKVRQREKMFHSVLALSVLKEQTIGARVLGDHLRQLIDEHDRNELRSIELLETVLSPEDMTEGEIEAEEMDDAPFEENGIVERAMLLSEHPQELNTLRTLRCLWPLNQRAFDLAENSMQGNVAKLRKAGFIVDELKQPLGSIDLPSTEIPGLATRYVKQVDARLFRPNSGVGLSIISQRAFTLIKTEEGILNRPAALTQAIFTPEMAEQQQP
jgi:hypothetical protein